MSVEQLQQRLADLRFSIEEQVKAYKAEQDQSEEDYAEWENMSEEEQEAEGEPDVIDNDSKIDALESAKDKLDEAIEALDGAMED